MTSSVIRKYVLAALCGAAIVGVGQSAQAATWDIDGGVAPSGPAGYGLTPGENNVLNQVLGVAGLFDTFNGATIFAAANLNATFVSAYNVSWVYIGSESDNVIRFSATGVAAFDDTNANNNCIGCLQGGSPQTGPVLMGTALNQTALTPTFSFVDQQDGSNVANGSNAGDNETPPAPNFLLSYAIFQDVGDPLFNPLFGPGLYLTASVTNIVAIGLNDTGFLDDNHDDFTLVAFISEANETPIPGALPLFASVLGGGLLYRRLRNRRQAKAAA